LHLFVFTARLLNLAVLGYVVVFALTAYMTRGLIHTLGISKRAQVERAEELGVHRFGIPLTRVSHRSDHHISDPPMPAESRTGSTVPLLRHSGEELQAPAAAQNPVKITGTGGPPVPEPQAGAEPPNAAILRRVHRPVTRAEKWAAMVGARLDLYTYAFLFVFVSLPVFFTSGYAMPAQLTLNILAYFGALALPTPWRKVMHPALVTSILTIVGIYVLSMIHGQEFDVGLREYRTNTKYQQLFAGKTGLPKPGAGDVLSSVLDVSIVALALPMYQHRQELKRSVSS
jgi:LrgB-like family